MLPHITTDLLASFFFLVLIIIEAYCTNAQCYDKLCIVLNSHVLNRNSETQKICSAFFFLYDIFTNISTDEINAFCTIQMNVSYCNQGDCFGKLYCGSRKFQLPKLLARNTQLGNPQECISSAKLVKLKEFITYTTSYMFLSKFESYIKAVIAFIL